MSRRYTPEELKAALDYDALDTAEKVTGESYKDNIGVAWLGMDLMMRSNDAKDRMLRANGDVSSRMTIDEYLAVITANGFDQVYAESFVSFHEGYEHEKHPEELFVYYRHPGQLLHFDTYRGSVNGGHVHYNVRAGEGFDHHVTSSGHYAEYGNGHVWSGDHDCREAVLFNLSMLAKHGEFIEPWVDIPWISIRHHMDNKDETGKDLHWQKIDWNGASYRRAVQFPDHVKKAISLHLWKQS